MPYSPLDAYRANSHDKLVWVKIGTAGTDNTATLALGSDYANGYAQVIAGIETTNLVTKTHLPAAAIDSSGNLVLTESGTDGYEDSDMFIVAVSKHPTPWQAPTMSTV